MDAANTLQIPRAVVSASDQRRDDDPEATMVVPRSVASGRTDQTDSIPAIAQEALTDVVSAPPGVRSRQRRLEDARARQAQVRLQQSEPEPAAPEPEPQPEPAEEFDGLIPTTKQPPAQRGTLSQRLDG